jgi:uncharacterized LabA/DUF88 family protein
MPRPVTYVYVDGFNLYYGLRDSCSRYDEEKSWRWLNLEELFRRLLGEFDVQKIRYFTAPLKPPYWAKAKRQARFLRALATLPKVEIHRGRYEVYESELPLRDDPSTQVWVLRSEEKQSDVALATWMLVDGLEEAAYEVAVVVSNDSDQLPAIRILREYGFTIGVLNPHLLKPSSELRDVASFFRPIRPGPVFASQFPDELSDEGGAFTKPLNW